MTVALVITGAVLLAWPARPRRTRRPLAPGASPSRFRPPSSPRRLDRRLPVLGIAVVLVVAVSPVVGLLVVGAVAVAPWCTARRDAGRHRRAVLDAVPEAADLFALAVAGGLTVTAALTTAGRWTPGPMGEALRRATEEIRLGRPTSDALEELVAALGEPARPLVGVLVASERYGVPVGDGLDRVAREARLERRRRAEERARRLPVLLLFPLVLCVLPAFGLLTVVPLLVGSLPDLPP